METNSHPEAVASTVKQGQYSPRKRKDTAPKVNPQLAIELFFQEMGRIEAYTKRIEDATSRKVQIDGKSLESAENRLKNVLSDFERQGYRMKNGGYVDKRFRSTQSFVLLSPYCSLVSCAIFGRMQPKTGTTTSSIMNTSKSRQGNKRETNKL